jgi:hypothetical protein
MMTWALWSSHRVIKAFAFVYIKTLLFGAIKIPQMGD